ncbi:MAG: MFS transporter [Puniceicoccales bacterium]|nr:MFS transporter [Puniceicoccales bacterium]
MKNSCALTPGEIDAKYRYWRFRTVYSLIIGYAAFYLVRQNFQVVMVNMLKEFNCTKTDIGWALTAFALIYGVGKFFGGIICDKTNARWFMTVGLLGSALCSICMGLSSTLWSIALFYAANGIFQSAGWPPVSRLMTQWYSADRLGTMWGTVNASHQIGSVVILTLGSLILKRLGWRYTFLIPAVVAIFLAFFLAERLRDSPQSLGLPSVEEKENLTEEHSDGEDVTLKEIFLKHILPNRALWYVCCANFFVYVIRMGFFNWALMFLKESRGAEIMTSAWMSSAFEMTGTIGGFLAGWMSDRVFGGRRNCTSFYFMIILMLVLLIFWALPTNSVFMNTLFFFAFGFSVYGPQTLVGVAGAEFGSRRAAATGAGLTGTFGYLGSAISGWGVGKIADECGWSAVFLFFAICAAAGAFFFMLNWDKTSQRQKAKA